MKQLVWTPCSGKLKLRSELSVCLTPNRAGKTDQWEAAYCATGSTKHEMCYKICKLALKRHMLRIHIHTQPGHAHSNTHSHTRAVKVSLHPSVFSGSQLLFPNGQLGLRKCDLYPICGQQMIFSCCKSFTRVSCHASPQRCQDGKPQISTKHRGQMWICHVEKVDDIIYKKWKAWNAALKHSSSSFIIFKSTNL